MSIIYDALKKVEKTADRNIEPKAGAEKEHRPRGKYKIYMVYALILCLGLLIGNIFFNFVREKTVPLPQIKPQALNPAKVEKKPDVVTPLVLPDEQRTPSVQTETEAPDPQKQLESSLILNGVFFSDEKGYVLINNQILQEGEVILGAVVKRITLEGVELECAGKTFALSNSSQ